MIEKLTCCLAHPMTALRNLMEKINEVITGHNELVDKVENLPAGGGGGSSGGSAGPGVNIVTFRATTADMQTFTVTEHDTSHAALLETYESGGLVWGRLVMDMSVVSGGAMGDAYYECALGMCGYNPDGSHAFTFFPFGLLGELGVMITFGTGDTWNMAID